MKRGVHEVDKRRRNLFDDRHLTVLKNRFVIQLNDSLFDSRALAVEADGISAARSRPEAPPVIHAAKDAALPAPEADATNVRKANSKHAALIVGRRRA